MDGTHIGLQEQRRLEQLSGRALLAVEGRSVLDRMAWRKKWGSLSRRPEQQVKLVSCPRNHLYRTPEHVRNSRAARAGVALRQRQHARQCSLRLDLEVVLRLGARANEYELFSAAQHSEIRAFSGSAPRGFAASARFPVKFRR
jgi:hypothetical protein